MEYLTAGTYKVYFKVLIGEDQVNWLFENFQLVINGVFEIIKDKHVKIYEVYPERINNETYIIIKFEVLECEVKKGLLIDSILTVLKFIGVLEFKKIEKLSSRDCTKKPPGGKDKDKGGGSKKSKGENGNGSKYSYKGSAKSSLPVWIVLSILLTQK